MEIRKSIKNRLAKITKRARRIFIIGYEDLSTQIYYDSEQSFRLIIVSGNESLLYEKKISRSQAFRIMNTR
jgi:hypothetical protein